MSENTEGVAGPTPLPPAVDRPGPDHRAPAPATVPSTATTQLKYYAKALIGAVIAGLTYFLTVLSPAAQLGDITLVQWIGFFVTTLGTLIGVAATSNGPKPEKK